MTEVKVDDFLEHYGVKGMKWGVRRKGGVQKLGSSKDSKKATQALKKAKSHGVKSLTNDELKNLNKRLQLEKSFAEVSSKSSKLSRGQAYVGKVMSAGDSINKVIGFANSPAGKAIAAGLTVGGIAKAATGGGGSDRSPAEYVKLLRKT